MKDPGKQQTYQEILDEAQQWVKDREAEGWTRDDFVKHFSMMMGIEDEPDKESK